MPRSRIVLLVFVLIATQAADADKKLPSHWKACKRSQPNFDSCLKDAVNVALSDISAKGLREFDIFPIDPFTVTHLEVTQGTGPVAVNLKFLNLSISGLKNCKLTSLVSDIGNSTFKILGNLEPLPVITLRGQYKISGRVLLLPVAGEGPCEINMKNKNTGLEIHGKQITKGGKKYFEVTDFLFPIKPEAFSLHFENLFNGNKPLGDQMNRILNENWEIVVDELQPTLQEAFGKIWSETSNRILLKVPSEKIFPK